MHMGVRSAALLRSCRLWFFDLSLRHWKRAIDVRTSQLTGCALIDVAYLRGAEIALISRCSASRNYAVLSRRTDCSLHQRLPPVRRRDDLKVDRATLGRTSAQAVGLCSSELTASMAACGLRRTGRRSVRAGLGVADQAGGHLVIDKSRVANTIGASCRRPRHDDPGDQPDCNGAFAVSGPRRPLDSKRK
jgi:hypothetical protein